jgi:hypothetical protein
VIFGSYELQPVRFSPCQPSSFRTRLCRGDRQSAVQYITGKVAGKGRDASVPTPQRTQCVCIRKTGG